MKLYNILVLSQTLKSTRVENLLTGDERWKEILKCINFGKCLYQGDQYAKNLNKTYAVYFGSVY